MMKCLGKGMIIAARVGKHKYLGLVVLLTVALILFIVGACGKSASSRPSNPLCTAAAATAFNAYWQEQIANSGNNFLNIESAALTATQARMTLCKGTSAG